MDQRKRPFKARRAPETRDRASRPRRFNRTMRRPMRRNTPLREIINSRGVPSTPIPPLAADAIRIIPLGGVEEVGRNMTALEIGESIFVIDCGFQFREDDTPGIDYILPNTQYLEENRARIKAMFVTHGHLDHIGGIPYILDRIGNPPIYTRKLTGLMIKKRHAEFAHLPEPVIREVEKDEHVSVAGLSVSFFAVTHTIPDSMGIIFETQFGDIVVTGDIKLDQENGKPTEAEEREFALFENRNVLALLMDSTNVERPGWSIPERNVFKTLEEIIIRTHGRIIVGTFASQLERLMRIVQIAEATDRRIVIDGRSMRTNIEIVRELGILKHKDETIVPVESMPEYPPEKLIILATGAQGDEFASLMRIANKNHKYISLTPKDTVVLSSSVIPGNERAVQRLKDNLSRQGAHIITYQSSDVHASGHGNREEAKWVHTKIHPKFFIPQHGYHYMLRVHADLIKESIGLPEENIAVPDNSSIIEIQEGGKKLVRRSEKVPSGLRVVEGQSIGELSDVLMRDRKALSQDGFCVVVATVDRRTGRLHKSPDIISRGFVYLRDNKDLMDQTRLIVRKSVESSLKGTRVSDLDTAKEELAENVSRFLLLQTQKHPIVIPVIVSV